MIPIDLYAIIQFSLLPFSISEAMPVGKINVLCPRSDLLEEFLGCDDFWTTDVFQRCAGMSIQGGKRGHVELLSA